MAKSKKPAIAKSVSPALDLQTTARFFYILCDATRIALIRTLVRGEMSVGAITDTLGLVRSNVSLHLRRLKRAGFVAVRRDGVIYYFSLTIEHEVTASAVIVRRGGVEARVPL